MTNKVYELLTLGFRIVNRKNVKRLTRLLKTAIRAVIRRCTAIVTAHIP